MRDKIIFEVRLPKNVYIENLGEHEIPIDEAWMVTVRRGHQNIEELPLRVARRKYHHLIDTSSS